MRFHGGRYTRLACFVLLAVGAGCVYGLWLRHAFHHGHIQSELWRMLSR
jgi:hypothetical protein